MRATEQLGPIDVLVNNAGVFAPTPFLELTPEAWDRTLQVNLYGAFHTSQRAARDWLAAGTKGAIVNIASIAAMTAGYGGTADYGASKAGLVGLTIHLAVDLGPQGIRTNAVAPGSFYSPMNAERLTRPGDDPSEADRAARRGCGGRPVPRAGRDVRERGRHPCRRRHCRPHVRPAVTRSAGRTGR
jgi:NAD(P)-dependent dehydrogenase (short-subunit alcohol dehydrogenase family)